MWGRLRGVVAVACLSVLWPAAVNGAEPSITPRQHTILSAMQYSSALMQEWSEPRAKLLGLEDALRRFALLKRCVPKPAATRLFVPAYRRYVDTIGGAYYRYSNEPVGPGALARKPTLWAIDQLSDSQYQRSLWWLTNDEAARARAARDLALALNDVIDNVVDVSTGANNLPVLVAFQQTLIRTGQIDPILAAIRKVSPREASTFESLSTAWPVPAAQLEQWENLAMWIGVFGERIERAYWDGIPEPTLTQLQQLLDDPLMMNLDRAQEAQLAWQAKARILSQSQPDPRSLNDAERLGREIDFYFGDPVSDDNGAVMLKAHAWLQEKSMAYIDANRADMCTLQ